MRHLKIYSVNFNYFFYTLTSIFENCALLGYHAGSSGNFLQTFRDNLSGTILRESIPEDGTDRLSRNVGKILPLLAEQ